MKNCFFISKRKVLRTVIYVLFINMILFSSTVLSSCSQGGSMESNVEITLVDASGNVKPGVIVYEYSALTWTLVKNNTDSANEQSMSDTFGVVKFSIPSISFTKPSETFYYSCHYMVNGRRKTSSIKISLREGDRVIKKLILK